MNHYPITIGSDTGGLGDMVSNFSKQQPVVRVATGAAIGSLVARLMPGKHYLIGALIGAAGGYIAAGWNSEV